MPFLLLIGVIGYLWYAERWPFDRQGFKTASYVAEVVYWRGRDQDTDLGSPRKTLEECRREADSLAAYRNRNSPTRVTSSLCLVYYDGQLDHRE